MRKKTEPSARAANRIEDPVLRAIVMEQPSASDPNGSYTGKPWDETETPVQDADDL